MKKILTILTLFFSITACDNDLNIINPNQPTVEVFWNDSDDAQMAVNAIYSTLHRGGISRWMPFYFIIRSDEGRSTSGATDIVNNMDQFIITDYNYGNAYAIWNDNYVGIFRANQVIANVPNIEMDETLKKRSVGEAKFLRGLFYYHLVSLWGNVPLILEPSEPSLKPQTSQDSYLEIWQQIELDLSEAADLLPTSYTNPNDLGRATKGAAYALLAKSLMQQQKYSEALIALEWLVEGEGKTFYGLMPNYRDNFLVSSENNIESVFEWQFQLNPAENHDDDASQTDLDRLNYGTSIAQFFGPVEVGWSDGEANRWLVREFNERTEDDERDPRLEASFLFDSTDVRGPKFSMIYGTTYFDRYAEPNPDNDDELEIPSGLRDRVWFRKFQNDHWKDFEGYNSPNNWRYIRYADVLLMYAECLNATSNTASAYQYVDRVRERAGLAPLSDVKPGMDQSQFLQQLKHERITELSGEGHRWNDLSRWGDLGPELAERDPGFSNFVEGKHELLPVPQQDRDINPLLVQNGNW